MAAVMISELSFTDSLNLLSDLKAFYVPSCEGGVRLVTDLTHSVERASPSLGESRIGSRVEEWPVLKRRSRNMPSLHGMRALPKGSGEASFRQMLASRFRTARHLTL